jgi:hypothetical protein
MGEPRFPISTSGDVLALPQTKTTSMISLLLD